MGLVLGMWGVGVIVGTSVGGLLARPGFAGSGFVGSFPYVLPAMFSAALSVVSFLVALALLQETHSCQNSGEIKDTTSMNPSRSVFIAICAYCIFSAYAEVVNEIYPLWAAAPSAQGGNGDTAAQIGFVLGLTGVLQTVCQFCYASIDKCLGARRTMIWCSLFQAPFLILLPFSGQCGVSISRKVSAGSLSAYQIAKSLSFTASSILINNSTHNAFRGTVNGWSMALASVGKALGPIFAAPLFAASIAVPHPYPFGSDFTWWLCAVGACGAASVVFLLPVEIDKPLEYDVVVSSPDASPQRQQADVIGQGEDLDSREVVPVVEHDP